MLASLYLIEILHQTTTPALTLNSSTMLYLIEILHQTTTYPCHAFFVVSLYLIEILHQTTTRFACNPPSICCILSKFYIKPQHDPRRLCEDLGCILSKFYIKPQLPAMAWDLLESCILSKFYIKPQQVAVKLARESVVSYRNSTSNHNYVLLNHFGGCVVSYRNSTSNHNVGPHID